MTDTFASLDNQAGFTLLELLVVLAIAAILMATAMPHFRLMMLSSARAQGSTQLVAAFNQARSEAIEKNSNVVVCRRNYFASSSYPTCGISSGTWAQGWIVYRDNDGVVDASEPDAAGDILAVYEPIGRVTASGDNAFNVLPSSNPAFLAFGSNGRPSQALSFTLCDSNRQLDKARRVDVALSGYVSLQALDVATTTSVCG